MTNVVALIHGEAGTYGISFPDFPGAASGGATVDEALARGRALLATHIEALTEEKVALPALRTLEEVRADPALAEDFADAVAVTLVPADLPGRARQFTISMDENLMARIDVQAKALGENRSRYLANAARNRLREDA
ncbi:type II toxin-antitoxin system HicB family antitoxin [Aureimonas mangrovi]|uniref:type II toxin-antitoxin system HicB family antitoxin n=1 Tax=Aureimonas mangrovi TaxID=2758041 RepID=UPI00163D5D70|nr:type II toxin-antitoxin system HicB family antitoxin [Aureimonas mangrovi]